MIVIETFLSCDRCGKNYGIDTRQYNGKKHRENAHANGWIFLKGKDYCLECKPLITMSPREK